MKAPPADARWIWVSLPRATFALIMQGGRVLKLVETNRWHDQFWGSCDCPKHDTVPGTNMLGELIMAIRAHHAPLAH